MFKFLFRLTLFGLPILILVNIGMSSAATLNVSSNTQNVFTTDDSITAEKVKPPECAGITLVDIRTGDGNANNNLIIGDENPNNLAGRDGDDCIVGVNGNDTLYGDATGFLNLFGTGNDIIIGGNGNDTIYGDGPLWGTGNDTIFGNDGNDQIFGDGGWGGTGNDSCDGGAGFDTSSDCDTQTNIP
jgi:Ca2+-binding RTX toxin-like protein